MSSFRLTCAPDGMEFDCRAGQSILEAALHAGVPIAHACGGKARCSTCRIWLLGGQDTAPPPDPPEAALKARLSLGPDIRLACQFHPVAPVSFRRLVLDKDDLAVANQLDRDRPAEAGEIRNVAVMFFDIAGFTAMSARMPPYDVMFLLNKWLTRVGRILAKHGGYFDKAIGDGFIAIFGVRGENDPALNAVAAALRILRAVDEARPMVEEFYSVAFDARIGMHYGEALIGALGPAGDERLTVIGDVANIASRVEQANKEAGTRLLVTEELYREVAEDVVSPDFVRLRVPGEESRRTLYEVTALSEDALTRLRSQAKQPAASGPGRAWKRLLDSAELDEQAVRIVPRPRFDVALTRQGGRVFAFNNHCPHNRLSFFGKEIPEDTGLPPTPACSTFPDGSLVACRFHGSAFDLETGRIVTWCPGLAADGTSPGLEVLGDLSKNEQPLETYRCREADGGIWVELAV